MLRMSLKIVESIRSRSREAWSELAKENYTAIRIWCQEHGEQALLAGIGFGVVLVVAFKLVVTILILLGLIGAAIYLISLSQADLNTIKQAKNFSVDDIENSDQSDSDKDHPTSVN